MTISVQYDGILIHLNLSIHVTIMILIPVTHSILKMLAGVSVSDLWQWTVEGMSWLAKTAANQFIIILNSLFGKQ
jgi:hypothetical protein